MLEQPDGSPGATLQLTFDPKTLGGKAAPVTVLTDDKGNFTLAVPPGLKSPAQGSISLAVHGVDGNAQVAIQAGDISVSGVIGAIVRLPKRLAPLPLSILGALKALFPPPSPSAGRTASPPGGPQQLPQVTLGETGGCQLQFSAQNTIDFFPFSVFFRLVEPQLSIVSEVALVKIGKAMAPLPIYATGTGASGTSYTDRIPVEQPLSIDGFRNQIMGLGTNGVFVADETVPMAATLGLGYVLEMQQQWTFAGLSLGDLVYSLPLAPGEQQQAAIFERVDTSQVTESEFFSETQAAEQSALSDSSTNSTFNSAFNQVAGGGSTAVTASANVGFTPPLGGLLGGIGGGTSASTGFTNQWMQGHTDAAQSASESMHSAAFSQANARRTAGRTAMRLASASESMSVTTKTIANHNHAHALTMQYWEVLRNYSTTTVIDGLTLCCLVPMQIVRFMPPGQQLTIPDTSAVSTRPSVLARYASLIKHLDVLQMTVPRQYQYGLTLLAQFAADPNVTVGSAGSPAEDVISIKLTGTFLPCETIWVRAVTRRNTRVGPTMLGPSGTPLSIPQDRFATQDALVAQLLAFRQANSSMLSGNLALPPSMNRADIVGFEILRSFNTLSYTLISPNMAAAAAIPGVAGVLVGDLLSNTRQVVTLSPGDLERALGGPIVSNFQASIIEPAGLPEETYANQPLNGVELPPQPFPVPALQLSPVLRYSEILEIEKAMHHIVRNTTQYSKAIWTSLTPDERAILLDGYTIGVPPDGLEDASQMVPLLNCVENWLLGFFGNSMILPFIVPEALAKAMAIEEPDEIQQGLLDYHRSSFSPPSSIISLPTRGVLGEAVLGHCASAEKIDLTRFWNWQDSPGDAAPTISPTSIPTSSASIAAGLSAPNTLSAMPSLINNVLAAPTPNTSLAQSLAQGAASQRDLSATLTGIQQLASMLQSTDNSASSARADFVNAAKAFNSQVVSTLGSIATAGSGSGGAANAGNKSNANANSSNSASANAASKSATGGTVASQVVGALLPYIISLL